MIIALENARHELIDMREKVVDLGSALRIDSLKGRVAELEQKTADPAFWSDQENSSKVLQELKQSKDTIEEYEALCARLEDAIALAELAIETEDATRLGIVICAVLPIIILIAGLVVFIRRRHL